jgi:chorismate synthase
MGSIQSIKGAEIGTAFDNTRHYGTLVHDAIAAEEGALRAGPTGPAGWKAA